MKYVFISAMENQGMDCFLCFPVKEIGIRSKAEGGSSQKVVFLCEAVPGLFQSQ